MPFFLAYVQSILRGMRLESALEEITRLTEQAAGYSQPANDAAIIQLRTLPVPEQRTMVRRGYAFISDDWKSDLTTWDYIWRNTRYHEVMNQALYFYQHRTSYRQIESKQLLGWADRCEHWAHSDDLAKIYADILEQKPNWILPTLEKWNRDGNVWKRRMSMTSLIEYASKRTKVLPFKRLMSFITPLLYDDEYYVQKGLGWTLREIGNAYPNDTYQFMQTNAGLLSPQAWTGATKNLPADKKAKLKTLRQQNR